MIPVQLIAAGMIAAVSFGAAWALQANNYERKISDIKSAQALAAHKQLEIAHAETIRLQATVTQAAKQHATRQAALANAVAGAIRERDGLRKLVAANSVQLSSASCSSATQYATTVNELLGQCADQLGAVAAKADGHASDALMLLEAWPTD